MIFYFCRFYYAEMRRKLFPKAPAKEGALSQISKYFEVYFIQIHFFKKPNKKKLTTEPKSYTAIILYVFFDSLLSICPKKIKTERWPKADDSPLHGEIFRGKFSIKI